ncbi:hypothetical protein [Bowmanella yangjiangensis]|uniref:Uncharacterized protein n=1 Tax=Bowmanella yangjiangensis TaxID=2811230 RepID=A0ABS3CVD9_9ALTE|nr:hypothetical protein [Bowmanella yangjiangensis]MBN7821092.1 hypothetical protein [Bowmanella yangjiangensis]
MNKALIGESHYTKSVRNLIKKVHDQSPIKDSLYEQAADYFAMQSGLSEQLQDLKQQVASTKDASSSRGEARHKDAQGKLKRFNQHSEEGRLQRYKELHQVCEQILDLTDAISEDESARNFSRLLGTILLTTQTEHRKVALFNQKSKHLYKATLCLLLLDAMLADKQISNPYVLKHFEKRVVNAKSKDEANQCPFRLYVKVPLLMTALLQDVGQSHPDVQAILKGPDGSEDEFRTLDREERQEMLKLSYQHTINYLKDGIGCGSYVGNSKQERELFNEAEKDKLKFVMTLIKSSLDPRQTIGNLLKIPQVYTSVVLSTKLGQAYDTLPKATLVLEKAAEKDALNGKAVQSFIRVVGHFPQGFGITYIPKDSDRRDLDRYEYAIVNGLYPENPSVPICRSATKNLEFTGLGHDLLIGVDNNLYYPQARKKLEVMSKERLLEILSKLVSNFEERKELALIPNCWHPYTFFSYAKHQNLWNKTNRLSN